MAEKFCLFLRFDYLLCVYWLHILFWLWLLFPPPLPASWGKSSISHLLKAVKAKTMRVCASFFLFCFVFFSLHKNPKSFISHCCNI